MFNFLNKYLGINKAEAMLVALVLVGLTLIFKENLTALIQNLFVNECDSLISEFLK